MKATETEQVRRYLQALRRLAPHTVWFGESGEEWEWMVESPGGGLPTGTELMAMELSLRHGGRVRLAPVFIGATAERRHKGVRMTVDVGSAHLRLLEQTPATAEFGAWLRGFYDALATRHRGHAPVWDAPRPDNAEPVRSVEKALARWGG
jgi:hypothetical protein